MILLVIRQISAVVVSATIGCVVGAYGTKIIGEIPVKIISGILMGGS